MCGIAGMVGAGAADAVARMVEAIAHRGPDDRGTYQGEGGAVALGHRRLSILDPTAAGHQPMPDAAGRRWIVHNGEVYNFVELRAALEREGCVFRSHTDTEVILAGYARWGAALLPRLRGMFAFAIWDAERKELFLARDRFGIKPLYLARPAGGALAFASEVRALLAGGLVSRRVDPAAVREYLAYGSVAEPRTLLADADALPAGSWMRLREGETSTGRWWDLEEATRDRREALRGISHAEAVDGLRARCLDATRAHLVSDVPVGAFLSGGIDSTAVVGLMAREVSRPIRTFAVGFEGRHAALDELRWARLAAERLGADHTEVVVTAGDAADAFDALLGSWDQPSLDGANTWFVSRATRRAVAVSLSGLGGDELFAGYPHFRRIARGARIAPRGAPFLAALLALGGRALPGRIRAALGAVAAPPPERFAALRRLMTDTESAAAAGPALTGTERDAAARRFAGLLRPGLDPVQQVSYVEAGAYLRDTLLRDADAMSMAHALELRPVLLDHELAEYAFALPARCKLGGAVPKRVLVDALSDLLPEEIVRRPKMGFELPLNAWLGGVLRPRAEALLETPAARALFAPGHRAAQREELAALASGAARPPHLWSQVVLLGYLERHGLTVEAG